MKATTDAARRLHESNPVADNAFAGAASDGIGRATLERIIASPPRPEPGPGRVWRGRRLLAIGAAAAVAAGLLVFLLPGAPRLTHPVHSAWQPAHSLPRGGTTAGPGGPSGTWRLASYLVSEGWQENPRLATSPARLRRPAMSRATTRPQPAARPT